MIGGRPKQAGRGLAPHTPDWTLMAYRNVIRKVLIIFPIGPVGMRCVVAHNYEENYIFPVPYLLFHVASGVKDRYG